MKKKKRPSILQIQIREAICMLDELESIKYLYEQLDNLSIALKYHNEFIKKYGITVVDNFEMKNTFWKSQPIRRYELKRIDRL